MSCYWSVELRRDSLLLIAGELGSQFVEFEVDTGSPYTVISRATFDRCGFDERQLRREGKCEINSVPAELEYFYGEIRFAKHIVNMRILVVPNCLSENFSTGLLGLDFLSTFHCSLTGLHTVHPRLNCKFCQVFRTDTGNTRNDLMRCMKQITVNGHKVSAVIDTGCYYSLIPRSVVLDLGLKICPVANPIHLNTLGNWTQPITSCVYVTLCVASETMYTHQMFICDSLNCIILGMRSLRYFDELGISPRCNDRQTEGKMNTHVLNVTDCHPSKIVNTVNPPPDSDEPVRPDEIFSAEENVKTQNKISSQPISPGKVKTKQSFFKKNKTCF